MVVPGTLRDSLVLLSVLLEQETELKPVEIMTDTGAYAGALAETKIRGISGRKTPQERPIWRRAGNVRFARTGWWGL